MIRERSRTLPRVRELKLDPSNNLYDSISRTLPRVRELKPMSSLETLKSSCRTLPRVRELKQFNLIDPECPKMSHPSQGA